MSTKRKQIVSHILIAIFALYYANICFFYHSHIINGVTIVHSHAHSQSHEQTGTHSSYELTLITALSSFQSLQAVCSFIDLGSVFALETLAYFPSKDIIVLKPVACISLRAPPSFCCIVRGQDA